MLRLELAHVRIRDRVELSMYNTIYVYSTHLVPNTD